MFVEFETVKNELLIVVFMPNKPLVTLYSHKSVLKGFGFGLLPLRIEPSDIQIFITELTINPTNAPYELAHGTNIPSEITPSNGPPKIPNTIKDICRTVAPTYSHKNERLIVSKPKKAANNFEINIDLS